MIISSNSRYLDIPFLLADNCRKNKIRTNEPEIHWKYKNSDPQSK